MPGIPSAHVSDAEPRSGSTFQPRDAQRRAKRGAEAPGQRTPLRRLLHGVVPRSGQRQSNSRFEKFVMAASTRRATIGLCLAFAPTVVALFGLARAEAM